MAKEWILNSVTNRFQLNFKRNVGAVSEEIRKCQPKTVDQWQNYYFANVRDRSHIDELGRKLYVKITEVIAAEKIAKSDRLLKLTVKAPEERTIVAGIAQHYQPEELIGRLVIIVANLKPAKLMGVASHGMVLAAKEGDRLVLSAVSGPVANGSREA